MFKYLSILILLSIQLQTVQAKNLEDLRKLKSDFEYKYTVQLFFEEIPFSTFKIDYEIVDKENYDYLYNYIILLDNEFAKYPKRYLRKTRLRAVALVRLLVNSGNMLVTAVPDFARKILFLDFKRGYYDETYQKHVIHHDFFHMIERELLENTKPQNDIWLNYNAPNVKYGKTGWAVQNNRNVGLMNHPEQGFSTAYAKSEIGEDKAEIYAQLLIKEEHKKLFKWIQKDKVLFKKVLHMKSFLEKHDNNFNKQYWETLNK